MLLLLWTDQRQVRYKESGIISKETERKRDFKKRGGRRKKFLSIIAVKNYSELLYYSHVGYIQRSKGMLRT